MILQKGTLYYWKIMLQKNYIKIISTFIMAVEIVVEIFDIFECLPNQTQLINILNFLDSFELYRRLLVSQV